MNSTESRIERVQRFAKIWWKSRADAGKSQEFMALGLGVSKKTIQNWEKGISSPDLFHGSEWFRLLGLNPLHYYLSFLYPSLFESSNIQNEQEIEDTLVTLIKQATSREQRELLYLMTGNHGSSWYSLLQMFTAHCHTSMHSRVSAARLILENYEMDQKTGALVCPDEIQPDLQMLEQAISQGKHAAENKENGYTTPPIGQRGD